MKNSITDASDQLQILNHRKASYLAATHPSMRKGAVSSEGRENSNGNKKVALDSGDRENT